MKFLSIQEYNSSSHFDHLESTQHNVTFYTYLLTHLNINSSKQKSINNSKHVYCT